MRYFFPSAFIVFKTAQQEIGIYNTIVAEYIGDVKHQKIPID